MEVVLSVLLLCVVVVVLVRWCGVGRCGDFYSLQRKQSFFMSGAGMTVAQLDLGEILQMVVAVTSPSACE